MRPGLIISTPTTTLAAAGAQGMKTQRVEREVRLLIQKFGTCALSVSCMSALPTAEWRGGGLNRMEFRIFSTYAAVICSWITECHSFVHPGMC
ncbi:hypothetical protein L873DRAFT_869614 [Choiromyces venosus 120613-1]|uniref:Uncharacterized protein n=1 Tax=Choiromyces venosus 120613-1 TaxID=1336337 RepID=A0A3N4K227_9PEZI|nr:hypothetical protein L873DRAFT_869614 [Choiromyces venosus 120613-1]